MTTPLRTLRVGTRALLAEYANLADTMIAFAGLKRVRPAGIIDVVPAARTILATMGAGTNLDDVSAWLGQPMSATITPETRDAVAIDVVYDGDDLDDVAQTLGLSREAIVAIHTSQAYRVAFTGFAPGFAYLTAPDSRLHIPRRSSPRSRVPAGAVGLAGEFSGVYPRATPGGWQLIGHTGAALWDEQRADPALLHPGDAVQFRAVRRSVRAAAPPPKLPETFAVTVVTPGLQLLLQDRGRPGYAADGVTTSGAADLAAHRAANDAVGNDVTAATLEMTIGGAELHFDTDTVIAITGANAPGMLERAESGVALTPGTPHAIPAGSTVRFGYVTRGVRTYLAVRGGWDAPTTLGSRGTDTLSLLGPEPLRAGSRLAISTTQPRTAVSVVVPEPTPLAAPTDTVTIDVTFGPRDDWFEPASREALTTESFTVSATSDRVGVRLETATPLRRMISDELPSEGVVRGAIQVPANGQPVIFLADHPVTGGYPVIAVVVPEHLDRIAQLPAGTTVRFRVR